jgi:putative ABC transport system permease protein
MVKRICWRSPAAPGWACAGPGSEIENAYLKYFSGWIFDSFGLRPALVRLLTESDDLASGANSVAVLSYNYWTSRFGRDPEVVGRTLMVDIFAPTMMKGGMVNNADAFWFRTMVRLNPDASAQPVREKLHAAFRAFWKAQITKHAEAPQQFLDSIVNQKVLLEPAASGVSETQRDYSRPLAALTALVTLVLLIACANMTNLMTAQASARARETRPLGRWERHLPGGSR